MVKRDAKTPPTTAALFRRMRRDHARVLARISDLERALQRSRRAAVSPARERTLRELLDLLEAQFGSHMAAEDETLYPAVLAALPAASGSIEPLFAEHAELRQMLRRLHELARDPASEERSEQIGVHVHDVADLLRLHIEKEEAVVFRLAPRLLSPREIAAVAARLSRRKTPTVSRRPSTRSKGVSR
ncbi:MAG TPA: hemerythrin domain-containing protein [Candidatus Eisenbacteria bacterium]|nr:hemerythrin domain-containing protein [Candidatus Eisenbacteria bacterium]